MSQPAASPDQYLVISSEMARWMGLSGGRSPDHQRRLVSGTGPGGNEPLPGRRLLPLIAQRSTLQRLTETGGLCTDTASHLPGCQSALTHLLSREKTHLISRPRPFGQPCMLLLATKCIPIQTFQMVANIAKLCLPEADGSIFTLFVGTCCHH